VADLSDRGRDCHLTAHSEIVHARTAELEADAVAALIIEQATVCNGIGWVATLVPPGLDCRPAKAGDRPGGWPRKRHRAIKPIPMHLGYAGVSKGDDQSKVAQARSLREADCAHLSGRGFRCAVRPPGAALPPRSSPRGAGPSVAVFEGCLPDRGAHCTGPPAFGLQPKPLTQRPSSAGCAYTWFAKRLPCSG
jgi:hypothetical protein